MYHWLHDFTNILTGKELSLSFLLAMRTGWGSLCPKTKRGWRRKTLLQKAQGPFWPEVRDHRRLPEVTQQPDDSEEPSPSLALLQSWVLKTGTWAAPSLCPHSQLQGSSTMAPPCTPSPLPAPPPSWFSKKQQAKGKAGNDPNSVLVWISEMCFLFKRLGAWVFTVRLEWVLQKVSN
jgi:hypothetical protein